MKRTFHIWVKNKITDEVKCKLVKRKSFAGAASDAYILAVSLKEETHADWDIMSINNTEFSYDPKTTII